MSRSNQRSAAAQGWRRWYWTPRWRSLARQQLAAEPLCATHLKAGQAVPATVCDHVQPHRGDEARFWSGPFQSLCASCHSGVKQREERAGRVIGSDASGRPRDPGHPWNRPKAKI